MKKKVIEIILNVIPIVIMILAIPVIVNDYWLTLFYLLIIVISLAINYEKNDILFLFFGFFIMTVSEYFFISTGVETFIRKSLFGIMPVWLPFLWSYGFVAIKRSVYILNKQ